MADLSRFARMPRISAFVEEPHAPQPAPPPPPSAPVALRPQLFLVETYRLTTQRTATGKGPPIASVALPPGAQQKVTITTSMTTSTDLTTTTTAMETQDTSVTNNFNSHVSNSSQDSGGTESTNYHLNANFHGDASVDLTGGEANAHVDAQGGCNTVRSAFSNAVENAADAQIGQTAASRVQNVSTQSADTKTTESTQSVQVTTVKNPNSTRVANFIWYQSLEQYTSFLCLADVQVAFRNTDSAHAHDRQVPLSEMDDLLNDVLDPAKVPIVRDAIKRQLQNVLDWQYQPTSIVEEVSAGSGKTILRLKKDLQSAYTLKDSSGSPVRTIRVDGLLVKAFQRVLPTRGTPNMDIVMSEHTAI